MSNLGPPPVPSSWKDQPPVPASWLKSPTAQPSEEPGLVEQDPLNFLAWALAAGVTGGWSVPAMVGAGSMDLASKAVSPLLENTPWYVRIPAELAAMHYGSKLGTKAAGALGRLGTRSIPQWGEEIARDTGPGTYRGPVSSEVQGPSPAVPTENWFKPELEYKGRGSSTTTGQWPLLESKTGEVAPPVERGFQSNTEGPSVLVNEAWPKVVSGKAPGSIWEDVVRKVEGETTKVPKGERPPTQKVIDQAARITEAITPPPSSVWGDVKNLANTLGNVFNKVGSPVLSAIERTAGQKDWSSVGPQLTALEGSHEMATRRIWQALFNPLVEKLQELPKAFHTNFIDTLEGRAQATTPIVQDAVNAFRQVFGTAGSAVIAQQKAGLKVIPLENYFMHEYDPAFIKGLIQDPSRQTTIVRKMVADGVAISPEEARTMIKDFLSRPSRTLYRPRMTGAEFDRTVNLPGWITDPARAVTQRGRAISRRLADLQVYGDDQMKVRTLIDQLKGEAHDRTELLFRYTMGRDPVEEGIQKLTSTAMGFQAMTSLSLSGVMNLSQPSLLALRTSLPNMARAIFRTAIHPGESVAMAKQLGIYADMAQKQLMMEMTGGIGNNVSRFSLKLFNFTERFVRAMAAEGGTDWAKTIQQKLLTTETPKEVGWLKRELTRLNFTQPNVERLFTTKMLTPEDVQLIKGSIADQISFLPRPGRKSEFYLSSPIGPVLLQFKNFLMNSGRLIKQQIVDEWRAGNHAPAYRAIFAVFPTLALIGEPFADLNSILRGSYRPVTNLSDPKQVFARAFDNVTQIGALGLGLGLIQEMTGLKPGNYKADFLSAVGGPTLGMLAKDFAPPAKSLYYFATGDIPEGQRQAYETWRRVMRRTPYLGPWVANQVTPSSVRPSSESMDTWQDRLGFTQRAINRQRIRENQARMRHQQMSQ